MPRLPLAVITAAILALGPVQAEPRNAAPEASVRRLPPADSRLVSQTSTTTSAGAAPNAQVITGTIALESSLASIGVMPGVASTMMRDPGCRDSHRRSVRVVEVRMLGDAGRAEFMGSGPVIKFDPEIMGGLPSSLQSFFLLHECAHHVLGHLFAPTRDSEKEADCWAMREGMRRGSFTLSDVPTWQPAFEKSRGSSMHLPGPQRLRFIEECGAP